MWIDQSKNIWIKIYVIKAHEFEKYKQHVKRVFIRSHVVSSIHNRIGNN
jgi:hypothetical protein